MCEYRGVMIKTSIYGRHFYLSAILKQSKIHLGHKLITVAYILLLNCTKFERDRRVAFLNIYILVT
jgi:hypothetical protein